MNERLPRTLAGALGALALAVFFLSGLQRLGSPVELGASEGTLLDHAVRFAAGKPVYGPPSLEFIPLAYMPGMPLLAAPLVAIFGPHYWIGRLLDLIAVAGLAALFVGIVRRETGSAALGLAGAGVFVMGQGFTQGCYDMFRPDVIMLLCAVGGAAVLRATRGLLGTCFAALLLGLAFVFKQHGLLFGLAMLPYLFVSDRRRLLPFALAFAICAGGLFLLLRATLGPWFVFYAYDVPKHWSQLSRGRIERYLSFEAFGRFGLMTIPGLLALGTRPWREPLGLWWWFALGGLATGGLATLDPYAFLHTLIPSLCAFALLGPIALHRLTADFAPERRTAANWAILGVVGLQFLALPYSPRVLQPPRHAAAPLASFEKFLSEQKRVLVVFHGYYTWEAGKGTGLSLLPLDDVIRAKGNGLLHRDPDYFTRLFGTLRRGPDRPVLVTDTTLAEVGDVSRPYWASIAPGYRLDDAMSDRVASLELGMDRKYRPRYVYVPVESDSAAGAATAR